MSHPFAGPWFFRPGRDWLRFLPLSPSDESLGYYLSPYGLRPVRRREFLRDFGIWRQQARIEKRLFMVKITFRTTSPEDHRQITQISGIGGPLPPSGFNNSLFFRVVRVLPRCARNDMFRGFTSSVPVESAPVAVTSCPAWIYPH
jgi:hypothetical protein